MKKEEIEKKLRREVTEIFYGHNYRRKKLKVAD